MSRPLALALGLALAACATTPEPAPTPDIPEAPSPSTQAPAPAGGTGAPGPDTGEVVPAGGARVVKTVPAPDSAVEAAPQDSPAPAPAPAPPAPPPPKTNPQAKAAFDRGVEASHKGEWAVAERDLKAALSFDPKLAYAWTNLGVIHERMGDDGQAISDYEKALELDPDQGEAWDYLTRLRCRTGKASSVEAQLRVRIQKSPAAIGPRLALVYALVYQQKYETAANEAKKVLKVEERNVRAMQLLAQVYYAEKKHELAKMVLENAKAIAPGDAVTWNLLGLVNLALDQKPQALEAFKQAVFLQPDFAEANTNYGALLIDALDYETAVKVLEAAVRAAPDFAAAHLNLGNAYRGLKEPAKAVAEYEKVKALRPDWPDTYYNLAILHLDSELPGLEPIPRLERSITYFIAYHNKGGKDDRVDQYMKDANKLIEKEKRAIERRERDKLRKAKEEKERAAEEAKARAEAEAKAKEEAEARARAETEEKARAEAEAKREAEEKKKQAEAEAKRKKETSGTTVPASKLGEEDGPGPAPIPPPPPAGSGKLGGDEK